MSETLTIDQVTTTLAIADTFDTFVRDGGSFAELIDGSFSETVVRDLSIVMAGLPPEKQILPAILEYPRELIGTTEPLKSEARQSAIGIMLGGVCRGLAGRLETMYPDIYPRQERYGNTHLSVKARNTSRAMVAKSAHGYIKRQREIGYETLAQLHEESLISSGFKYGILQRYRVARHVANVTSQALKRG